ncbi:hypothetical protein [Herbiconiux daphne]|uniref:Uncharacterized protein n=1 Tax=Herbiconiux daphne TaxID=2970914 RepID=A0ABT2H9Y0_9MICO|nr:hypothetical protein [Herbiconiux daphne]MCS5736677.1 hypothetical protein [Herbiconiux daphne]
MIYFFANSVISHLKNCHPTVNLSIHVSYDGDNAVVWEKADKSIVFWTIGVDYDTNEFLLRTMFLDENVEIISDTVTGYDTIKAVLDFLSDEINVTN